MSLNSGEFPGMVGVNYCVWSGSAMRSCTGNYMQSLGMEHDGGECEKKYDVSA